MATNKRLENKYSATGNASTSNSTADHLQSGELAQKDIQTPTQIVAVGASAGGLVAIEQFLASISNDLDCAYVVIQHMSLDFRALVDEMLPHHSTMKIHRIDDGMEIQPNSIYLNSPGIVVTIDDNQFRAKKVDSQHTVYFPIDQFFKSLALNRGKNAIGVVLSGTGIDGTKGSTYVHDAGGAILVQLPHTAQFSAMPRSVINNGFSTLAAPPDVLSRCVKRLIMKESLDGIDGIERSTLINPCADVLAMLKHTYGTDFLQYKDTTIHRRIERRAQMRGVTDINDYSDILAVDKHELFELYTDLLIEVTEFFRDQEAFEVLEKEVIPTLVDQQKEGVSLRVWVPGCASGEEAYSIAILMQEYARSNDIALKLKIIATDVHVRSMYQASSGIYNESALKNVPAELIERYFDSADGLAQIKPVIRDLLIFSTHDLTRDPPFTRIDLVSCRNILIYLKGDAQEKVMKLLHFSLRKDGYLLLGPCEHIGTISHEFELVNKKWRMYKKLRDVKLLSGESTLHSTDYLDSSAMHSVSDIKIMLPSDETILLKRAHRTALESIIERHAPPGFLLAENGDVVHVFGNAAELIPSQAGTFSHRLVDMITPELKVIVATALDQTFNQNFTEFKRSVFIEADGELPATYLVSLSDVEVPEEQSTFQLLTIEKEPLYRTENNPTVLRSSEKIVALDASEALQQRIKGLEHNLQSSEESLQWTIEELQTSNEELQNSKEELMSTYEELQCTDKELHSVNKELHSISAKHRYNHTDFMQGNTDIDALRHPSRHVNPHEYQTSDRNSTEEVNYRNALEELFLVFSEDKLDVNKKIDHLLKVGCDYYQLESATLGMITGETFEVRNVVGKFSKGTKIGKKILLKNTFSNKYFDKQASLAIDSISETPLALTSRIVEVGADSYIGATVHNSSGPYGTINFFSKIPRTKPYNTLEESFVLLLSRWIGFMVENQEITEFIQNQAEYYKSLFRNVPVMLFLCDKDGLIISASDRLCERLELEPDTLPGKNCLNVLDIIETAELKAALTDGNVSRLPLTMMTPNGTAVEIELNSSIKPVGTLQGVRMVVLINVSDRNHALRDSEGQNRRLEEANEGLNQFAFIASHDLQEPLRKIQQFSSFLEEDLEDQLTEDGRFHLNTIVEASARMSTLIHDLLSYSGASKEEPRMENISLNRLMKDVLDELTLIIEESSADIQIGPLPDIEGDKVLVRQLLTNLMSNSIKYRSQDRPIIITLNGFGENNKEGVTISDNGIGFEMKFAQKIFEPFNRLHGADEYKGNGIGLAICSTVCNKHNWHLSVASEVDVGSSFTIKFNQ